jgi:hypothetical protein
MICNITNKSGMFVIFFPFLATFPGNRPILFRQASLVGASRPRAGASPQRISKISFFLFYMKWELNQLFYMWGSGPSAPRHLEIILAIPSVYLNIFLDAFHLSPRHLEIILETPQCISTKCLPFV